MQKIKRHIKRHYKKLAAITGAACLSAAIMSGIPAALPAAPAPKPIETQKKTVSENKDNAELALTENSVHTSTGPAEKPTELRQDAAGASQAMITVNKDNQSKEQTSRKLIPTRR